METNSTLTEAIAHIIDSANRAGLPHSVVRRITRRVSRIYELTPTGQSNALARWDRCMQTWPGTSTLQGAA